MPPFRLVSADGNQSFEITPGRSLVVGRGLTSDVPVFDATISRRHAELTAGPDEVQVRDLGSSNGTWINGRRIRAGRLRLNDSVIFGKVTFRLCAGGSALGDTAAAPTEMGGTGSLIVRELEVSGRTPGVTSRDGPPPGQLRVRAPSADTRQAIKLSMLLDVSQKLAGELDLERLLRTVADMTFEVMEVDRVTIELRDEDTGELIPTISRTKLGDVRPQKIPRSIADKVVHDGVAVVSHNIPADTRFKSESIRMQSVRSAMCSPLMAPPDRILGLLYVDNVTAATTFSDEDLQFLVAFSGLAAIGIKTSRYAEQIQRQTLVRSNFERYFASHVATEIARQGTAIQLGGERRAVTVLFSDIRGFTAMAESMGPAAIATLLSEYFSEMVEVIFEHGGTLDKFIGDAIMALFGAPVAHEDDADRAVAAALAMQATLVELSESVERQHGFPLAMRIGLNAGLVVAGSLGRTGEYTVIGDAVNVASRIQPMAEPGGVVVSDTVRSAAGGGFRFREVGEKTIRGRHTAVRIYVVEGASGVAEPPDVATIPCVGREPELARLRAHWEAAVAGEGSALLVLGEAGMGKTRLVREFLAGVAAASAFIATGQCRDYGAPLYLPMRQLFEALLTQSRSHGSGDTLTPAGDLAALERVLTGQTESVASYGDIEAGEAEKRVAHRSFLSLLGALSRQRPLLLVIEDLHWADPLTWELTRAIHEQTALYPILLIGTQRPEVAWPDDNPPEVLALAPLADVASLSLTHALLPPRVDDGVAASLAERAQGNPFYLEELCRALREEGALVLRANGWQWASDLQESTLPDSVRHVIQARIDRLDPASRVVVREAAVLGSPFARDVLRAVLSMPVDLDETLEALAAAEMMAPVDSPPEQYQFRQNLIEQVAYEGILARRRREMHARIGAHLEAAHAADLWQGAEALAHHFQRSDDDERALRYLLLAAQKAQSLYTHERTVALYEQALQRIESAGGRATSLRDEVAAHGGLADVDTLQGHADAAITRLVALRDRLAVPADHGAEALAYAGLRRRLGYAYGKRSGYDAAEAEYRAALRMLRENTTRGATAEEARIWSQLAQIAFRRGRSEDARAQAEAGMQAAEQAGEPNLGAGAMLILGLIEQDQGHREAARQHYEECLAIRERFGDPRGTAAALNNLGNLAMDEGRWAEAETLYRRARDLRLKIGFREGIAHAQSNLGIVRLCLGRLDAARECFADAARIGAEIGDAYTRLAAEACLGRLALEEDQPDAAIVRLEPTLEEARALELADLVVDLELSLGEAHLERREINAAEALAAAAARHAAEVENPLAVAQHLRLAGRIAAVRGRQEDAITAFRASRDAYADLHQPHELARTLIAWAAATQGTTAASLRKEARELLRKLGAEGDLRRLESTAAVTS
jgi:adenylate cyclase